MVVEKIVVTGMHCPKCTERVEKAVGAIDGVNSVQADYEEDMVEVGYDGSPEVMAQIKEAITEEDFDVA